MFKIDKNKTILKNFQKVDKISAFHAIEFEEETIKYFRYFNVGKGLNFERRKAIFNSGLEILEEFETSSFVRYSIPQSSKKRKSDISESEITIKTSKDVIIKVASKLNWLTASEECPELEIIENFDMTDFSRNFYDSQGWAIPKRNTTRFSFGVKNYLLEIFNEGIGSKKKIKPQEASSMIINAKKTDGSARFMPKEYLTVKQIGSLFSTFNNLSRKGKLPTIFRDSSITNAEDDNIDHWRYDMDSDVRLLYYHT